MSSPPAPPWRVLIAEDEVLLATTLRSQLQARGVEVVGTALNGQAALELCHQTHPDAVLMDIRMPVMDGLEATRRIMRECPTRVLVLTAMDAPDTQARAQEAGAAGFLRKPADAKAVLAALERAPAPSLHGD